MQTPPEIWNDNQWANEGLNSWLNMRPRRTISSEIQAVKSVQTQQIDLHSRGHITTADLEPQRFQKFWRKTLICMQVANYTLVGKRTRICMQMGKRRSNMQRTWSCKCSSQQPWCSRSASSCSATRRPVSRGDSLRSPSREAERGQPDAVSATNLKIRSMRKASWNTPNIIRQIS